MSEQTQGYEFIFGSETKPFTGRKMAILIGGFFGTIILVNILFSYFALTTWTGLETEGAYDKGLNYNKALDKNARQNLLKWQIGIDIDRQKTGIPTITVTFKDKTGEALTDLKVLATLRRPTHENDDRQINLTHKGGGHYSALLPGLKSGNWRLILEAETSQSFRYYREARIWLAPQQQR